MRSGSFELQRFAPLVLVGSALLAIGCDDLARFSTGPGEAYCGSVTLANEFRTGLSPRVQMRLRIDASRIDTLDSPGTLATYEAADETTPVRRLLVDAELRPIVPMQNDPLSQLDFGEGRERNVIYAVSPADPSAEALFAVVSLVSVDESEVRLLRAGQPEATAGRAPIFGIFPLSRRDGDCGF